MYRFDLRKAEPFQSPEQFPLSCFITAWSAGPTPDTLLGASFYDGVDVLLNIASEPKIESQIVHNYRQRSDDIRQTSPHPHHICLFPNQAMVCSVDMGIDAISLMDVTPNSLNLNNEMLVDAPQGDGPRILRLRRDGRFAYLLNEISNSVTVFSIEISSQTGLPIFTEVQRLSVISEPTSKNSPAGFMLSSDEQHLLISNRGEDSLVLYSVDSDSGILIERHRVPTAAMPRDISVIDDLIVVAAQGANTVQVFQLNSAKHQLRFCSETSDVQSPVAFLNTDATHYGSNESDTSRG